MRENLLTSLAPDWTLAPSKSAYASHPTRVGAIAVSWAFWTHLTAHGVR
jgi:hypothetical protein